LKLHQCSFLFIDQKNREAELSRKCAQEEEEMKEAAKNQKMVAESFVKLCATLGERMTGMVRGNSNQINEEKLNDVKNDIMKKVEDKLDERFNSSFFLLCRGYWKKTKIGFVIVMIICSYIKRN
jgi:hypothetical protein